MYRGAREELINRQDTGGLVLVEARFQGRCVEEAESNRSIDAAAWKQRCCICIIVVVVLCQCCGIKIMVSYPRLRLGITTSILQSPADADP